MKNRVSVLVLSLVLVLSVASVASASWKPYIALSVGSSNTITIDGDLSDWRNVPGIKLGHDESQVVRGFWNGPEDLSGTVYLQWTTDYLLLAADVTDDVGILSPGRIDNGDSVGITIDLFNGTRPDLNSLLLEMTPYPPNDDWNRATLFRLASVWRSLTSNAVVRAQTKTDGTGYYLEAAIPFTDLSQAGKTLNPLEDRSVFFNVILTDSDGGPDRKSVLQNTRTSWNPVSNWYTVPVEFTSLIFRGDGSGHVKITD